jgi:hypothetical protein
VHGGENGVEFRPFFILSAGRSGSTLLRAILMQHPTVSIPPESFVLGRVVKRFQQDYSRLDWRLCARLVASEFATGVDFQYWNIPLDKFIQQAEKIPTDKRNLAFLVDQLYQFYASHHKPEATRWGDKSTNNILFIDAVLKVYPQARFIHLIRDGRDVVASRLARGWHTDVNLACDMWLKLVGHGLDTPIRDHEGSFLEVRYEELVSEAEVVVPQIADFLGLSFVPEMLQPQKIVHTLGDADRAIHEHLNEPISPAHIGKWRQILSPADQLVVQERLGAVLISLGYDI